MTPSLIIFDCDGVLVDSEILSAEVLIAQLARLGIEITIADVYRDFLGRSFPTVAKVMRESFATTLPHDFEQEYRARLLAEFETRLHPTDGLAEMLEGLDLPRCVATSSSPPRVARALSVTGLDRYFEHVFTASQVANGKPAPDLFLFAAEQMGADPARTLVIEDSLPGLAAARAANMPVLRYTGASHLRGQDGLDTPGVPCFADWRQFHAQMAGL
ncbi:HAD family hydrolase [Roseobacter sp. HKCCA0434]|uniref:HAD family hydrolase n=1 Tax=Roseobacter sp. HKCCA0434 TaxID=3079297 RepID=UPI002905BBD3|nr:HAD family hydrolase [Roseobacter sp. HKCCA0434]